MLNAENPWPSADWPQFSHNSPTASTIVNCEPTCFYSGTMLIDINVSQKMINSDLHDAFNIKSHR